MIITDIQKLLDIQLKTVTSLPTVFTENMKSNQTSGTTWCRSTLLPARTAVATIGVGGQQQYHGLYQIDLFYPKDRGFANAGAMADNVIAKFQPGTRLAGTGFSVLIDGAWRIAGGGWETFYNCPVQVEWSVWL
jgi:hypothetical protein